MKNTLIAIMILIIISINTAGQKSQDTLYLKDGNKVAGKLVEVSLKEYRLQAKDGKVFVFTTDFVEKFVPAITPANRETTGRIISKANPDTLTIDELNLYNAIKLRNAGRIATISGLCVASVGIIAAVAYAMSIGGDDPAPIVLGGLSGLVGITTTLVGIPIWVVGSNRKTKAELTLQKLNISPQGSMAVGLGLIIKF